MGGNDRNYKSSVNMLDARNGRVLRATQIGRGAAPVAMDEQDGRVIIANVNDSTLSIVDARTGRLVRTIPTTVQGPTALTISAGTGRVFVASADVSNGPVSGTSNDSNLLVQFGHMGANTLKALRHDWTGSVTMLDPRALR